jgi:hypothetical protein
MGTFTEADNHIIIFSVYHFIGSADLKDAVPFAVTAVIIIVFGRGLLCKTRRSQHQEAQEGNQFFIHHTVILGN